MEDRRTLALRSRSCGQLGRIRRAANLGIARARRSLARREDRGGSAQQGQTGRVRRTSGALWRERCVRRRAWPARTDRDRVDLRGQCADQGTGRDEGQRPDRACRRFGPVRRCAQWRSRCLYGATGRDPSATGRMAMRLVEEKLQAAGATTRRTARCVISSAPCA